MSSIFELLANWITVNYGLESLVEKLWTIQQQGPSLENCSRPKIPMFFARDTRTANPSSKIEIGQIKWTHGVLEGAWEEPDAAPYCNIPCLWQRTEFHRMNIQLDADIKLKPKKEFKDIEIFPLIEC